MHIRSLESLKSTNIAKRLYCCCHVHIISSSSINGNSIGNQAIPLNNQTTSTQSLLLLWMVTKYIFFHYWYFQIDYWLIFIKCLTESIKIWNQVFKVPLKNAVPKADHKMPLYDHTWVFLRRHLSQCTYCTSCKGPNYITQDFIEIK